MKTTVNIEIEPEDLRYELTEVIEKLTSDELRKMVNTYGRKKVASRIDDLLEPIVMSCLTGKNFQERLDTYMSEKKSVEQIIHREIVKYFDASSYVYSKTATNIDDYAHPGSGGYNETRLGLYIQMIVRKYINDNFTELVTNKLNEIIENKEKLEAMVNEQLSLLVNAKLK